MKDNSRVMVSICCTTYNQERYIRQTLESFVMQKTNFKFEVIVHDDASTDKTASIIREYEKKYPDLFKPIYQTENQYSKRREVVSILFAKATGKYIALCEGDDYWCDENKIQKQFDFMESHCDCSLVTNGAKLLFESTGKFQIKEQPYKGSRYYSTDEIILGDGGLFATNSMFFKSEYVNQLPKFYYVAPVGDFPLTIYLSLKGKVYFLEDVMSVYRVNAVGSWSENMNNGAVNEKLLKFHDGLCLMFDQFNVLTNNVYKKSADDFLLRKEWEILSVVKDYDKMKQKKYRRFYKTGKLKNRVKNFIKIRMTFIYKFLKG